MSEYVIKIELLSETILGSGESVPGYVDLDILYDEIGLPYFKGKTLKGRLREEAENIARLQGNIFSEKQVNALFGEVDSKNTTKIALSDCTMSPNVKNAIKLAGLTQGEILNSLTEIRNFTSINDNGVSKDGSLRQMRVINKGLKLASNVSFVEEIKDDELLLLGLSVMSLKYVGLMGSRGKGNVKCTLLRNGEDMSVELIGKLREKVK